MFRGTLGSAPRSNLQLAVDRGSNGPSRRPRCPDQAAAARAAATYQLGELVTFSPPWIPDVAAAVAGENGTRAEQHMGVRQRQFVPRASPTAMTPSATEWARSRLVAAVGPTAPARRPRLASFEHDDRGAATHADLAWYRYARRAIRAAFGHRTELPGRPDSLRAPPTTVERVDPMQHTAQAGSIAGS
jgi:hypothetical protein